MERGGYMLKMDVHRGKITGPHVGAVRTGTRVIHVDMHKGKHL